MATQAEWEEAFGRGFGQVLRDLRLERRLGQEQLAEASRLHENTIRLLEQGKRLPSLLIVFHLAAGLKLPPSALVARVEEQVGPIPWPTIGDT